MFLRKFLILLSFSLALQPLTILAKEENEAGFDKWKAKLEKDAKKKGYEKEFLKEIFSQISYSQEHLDQDKKQFKPQTFEEYYSNAVNASRIKKSKKHIKKYKELLSKAEAHFLVPKEYIVSLWAMETDLGRVTGNFNVFNSLANLSYNKRRRELFLAEFFAAVEVAKANNIKAQEFKGSWAGAIGQCQFLPSTYLNHGYDFNKDEKRDIWSDKQDVAASVANYLKNLGWSYEIPWGYEVKKIKDLEKSINFKERHSLQYLVTKYDLKKLDGSNFSEYELLDQAKIVVQEDRMFVTFKNFDLIKKWNNSTYFALTVGLLADHIKD